METRMEIAIGFCIGIIIAVVFHRRKQPRNVMPSGKAGSVQRDRNQLQQTDEELITVILPTINHDK